MQKSITIYQIDSFTKQKFTGNPAGVVMNADGLTALQMQKIARELNNSETAFILSDSSGECDMQVRFFTPTNEVPICGHATIAAHYALAVEKQLNSVMVYQKTGVGILPVEIIKDKDDYHIVMTQGEVSVSEPLMKEYQDNIIDALGIKREDVRRDCPIAIASTGYSKVMIGIKDIDRLHRLTPDLTKLSDISKAIGCNGYYVFTLHPGADELVHGRMFAPAVGVAEDPVTGNANGPLGAYLIHYKIVSVNNSSFSFKAVQGEAMGRTGSMQVCVNVIDGVPKEVKIIGDAVILFKAQIEIELS